MTENSTDNKDEDLHAQLQRIIYLLRKYKLVEGFVNLQKTTNQEVAESPIQKQNLEELKQLLDKLHPADIAYILEALPLEERLIIWNLVKTEYDGDVLLETSDAVR